MRLIEHNWERYNVIDSTHPNVFIVKMDMLKHFNEYLYGQLWNIYPIETFLINATGVIKRRHCA